MTPQLETSIAEIQAALEGLPKTPEGIARKLVGMGIELKGKGSCDKCPVAQFINRFLPGGYEASVLNLKWGILCMNTNESVDGEWPLPVHVSMFILNFDAGKLKIAKVNP